MFYTNKFIIKFITLYLFDKNVYQNIIVSIGNRFRLYSVLYYLATFQFLKNNHNRYNGLSDEVKSKHKFQQSFCNLIIIYFILFRRMLLWTYFLCHKNLTEEIIILLS